jgi:uncharacterized protein
MFPNEEAAAVLDSLAIALQFAVLAYLVLGEGPLGKYLYQDLIYRAPSDPGARTRFYRWILGIEWGLSALLVLAFALEGSPLPLLGLRPASAGEATMAMVYAVVGGLAVGVVLNVSLVRFVPSMREKVLRRMEGFNALLPVTGREKLWYAALAITAGICEEFLFRGFVLYIIPVLVPAMPAWGALALSAVIFGLAHSYQGWKGVLQTGLVGLVFGMMYRYTGSLYAVMAFHALIDLMQLAVLWALGPGRKSAA